MNFRRPWSSISKSMQILEQPGVSSSVAAMRPKRTTSKKVDKRSYEERVFGKGLFGSCSDQQAPQTHGVPLYIIICGVCIVFSCLLVILLGTNILIQLRTMILDDHLGTAMKFIYISISLAGIYGLVVGNSWLFKRLSLSQRRNSTSTQYSSLSGLEENYEMEEI